LLLADGVFSYWQNRPKRKIEFEGKECLPLTLSSKCPLTEHQCNGMVQCSMHQDESCSTLLNLEHFRTLASLVLEAGGACFGEVGTSSWWSDWGRFLGLGLELVGRFLVGVFTFLEFEFKEDCSCFGTFGVLSYCCC
jgi:hypothetical protein